jgi:hypothetical protein
MEISTGVLAGLTPLLTSGENGKNKSTLFFQKNKVIYGKVLNYDTSYATLIPGGSYEINERE